MSNLVKEDDTSLNFNKWVQGIASRELNSQQVFMKDVMSKKPDEEEQHPNKKTNNNVLPEPLPKLVVSIGNAISELETSITNLKSIGEYPLFKDVNNKNLGSEALKELKSAVESIKKSVNYIDKINFS